MGTAELQKQHGVYPRAAVDVWVGAWVGHPGELRQGLENRKGERERQREIQGGNEQPQVWALFMKEVGPLGHVFPVCVLNQRRIVRSS